MASLLSGSVTFVLLIVLCKAFNDMVYWVARKHQNTNGMAWALTHTPWIRWSLGGILGFGLGLIMAINFIQAVIPRPYVAPPPLAPIVNPYENVVIPDTKTNVPDSSPDIVSVNPAKEDARRWAAYAIWMEARGERRSGRIAVASVLWNRAGGNPGNIVQVLQNTNWLGSPEIMNPALADTSCPVYQESWVIASNMVEGQFESVGKWTHFYNPAKATPDWGWKLVAKKKIGNHLFGVLP